MVTFLVKKKSCKTTGDGNQEYIIFSDYIMINIYINFEGIFFNR